MLPAFLTTLFFSLSAVSGNRCARAFGGLEANFYRLLIAFTLLATYAGFFGQPVAGSAATVFVLSGLIGVGLGDMLFFQALPRLNSRLTILLIQCLSVPFAAAVEWLWLGTVVSWKQSAAVAVILVGIALAVLPKGGAMPPNHRRVGAGIVFAVLAAVGNGLGAVLSRKAYALADAAGQRIDGPTAAFHRVLGGLAIALVVITVARWPVIRGVLSQREIVLGAGYRSRWRAMWPWVITTALAGQTFGVTCFQWALKTQPTAVVLPIVALTPLVAIPFAYYLEGERPCRRSLLGGIVAVAGVIALLKSGS